MFIRKTLYAMLTPPSIFFIALFLICLFYYRDHMRRFLFVVVSLFFLLSTPLVADKLHDYLNVYPALTQQDVRASNAQAIVVLSGGIYGYADEYQHNIPNASSMLRALYAAKLHRQTKLPILISGGDRREGSPVGSALIQNFMQLELNTPVSWTETNSETTIENAQYTYEHLSRLGITNILLVTQSYHMRRSVYVFEKVGFDVTAAPTYRSKQSYYFSSLDKVIPSANDFNRSMTALHEVLGMLWYQLESSQQYQNFLNPEPIALSN